MSSKPRTPLLNDFYQQYLIDQDAAGFAARIAQHYTAGTLERMVAHSQRMTRRAAVLALGFLGDFRSNEALGRALTDGDRAVRTLAENGIRALWCRDGSHSQQLLLGLVIRHNGAARYEEAIRRATELVEQAPWLAEAWNQRAIAHFQTGHWAASIRDCRHALAHNPFHFAAAAGMGQCHLKLTNHAAALESFHLALRINPGLEQVRTHVAYLQRTLKNSE